MRGYRLGKRLDEETGRLHRRGRQAVHERRGGNEAVLKHIVENEARTWRSRCVSLAGLGRGAEGEGEKGD